MTTDNVFLIKMNTGISLLYGMRETLESSVFFGGFKNSNIFLLSPNLIKLYFSARKSIYHMS